MPLGTLNPHVFSENLQERGNCVQLSQVRYNIIWPLKYYECICWENKDRTHTSLLFMNKRIRFHLHPRNPFFPNLHNLNGVHIRVACHTSIIKLHSRRTLSKLNISQILRLSKRASFDMGKDNRILNLFFINALQWYHVHHVTFFFT